MPKPKTKAASQSLPPGVTAKDLSYPEYGKEQTAYDVGLHGTLTFYETTKMGWVLATLGISKGRGSFADRTYGVRVEDGAIVRVGSGPHVKQTLTVYVRETRRQALQRYADLYTKGLADAGSVRDRISSRRAQGQMERAAGRRSWRWDI